ncbi:LysR family transcriptional regulator [Pelagibacterium xiamenense]|uniref:LysR family transcriptional regulator n=1 Tax=Pelagibacterium xiamenense TaxID=2901140 RepID=UPI001E5684B7|nr:LysR family transcriptional regulator [Pelagibacterium xiamenense]MCD7059776.1 LysR family transcriptional regulator [Pelagibacterium xiamenense]
MYSLDPDFLRTFLAISETGSFGAAGTRINKTQSTVSAQMKRLEDILGVSLFEKDGRRNVLTADGRKLLEYAASMVRLNDETVNAFRPPEVSGTIRIGAVDEYAQAFFPEVLSTFAVTHPSVQVDVVTGTTRQLRPRVEDGTLDAAVISCYADDTNLEVLRTDRLHWIGAPGRTLHFEDPIPLSTWSDGCSWRDAGLAALARAGRQWRVAFTSSNASLLSITVRNGLGITVAPSWFVGEGMTILSDLDAQCPLVDANIGIKRHDGVDDAALETFLAHLRRQFTAPAVAA